MILISAENITYSYDRTIVLESISFSINERDRIALLGKNGSGKSTLIKGLNRLLAPSKGCISFYFEELKRNYDTQIYTLFSNPDEQILMDTVYAEIALGLLQQGKKQEEIENIVEKSLTCFGLLPYIHNSPYLLSTGEKKNCY